jgi:copper chaperone CopZ
MACFSVLWYISYRNSQLFAVGVEVKYPYVKIVIPILVLVILLFGCAPANPDQSVTEERSDVGTGEVAIADATAVADAGVSEERAAGQTAGSQTVAANTSVAADKTAVAEEGRLTLAVDGVVCLDCVFEIRDAVTGIEGVDFVLIDSTNGTADVFFDPAALESSEVITDELRGAGYVTTVLPAESR